MTTQDLTFQECITKKTVAEFAALFSLLCDGEINSYGNFQNTPVIEVLETGGTQIEQFLVVLKAHGASMHAPNQQEMLPLDYAIWRATKENESPFRNFEIVRLLLVLGADPNYSPTNQHVRIKHATARLFDIKRLLERSERECCFQNLSILIAAGLGGSRYAIKFFSEYMQQYHGSVGQPEIERYIKACTTDAARTIRNCILPLLFGLSQLNLPALCFVILVKAVCKPFHRMFKYHQIWQLVVLAMQKN